MIHEVSVDRQVQKARVRELSCPLCGGTLVVTQKSTDALAPANGTAGSLPWCTLDQRHCQVHQSRVWPTSKRLRSGTMRIDKLCCGSQNLPQLDDAGLVVEGVEIVVHEADEPDQTKPS